MLVAIIFFILGTFAGVFIMCLFSINKTQEKNADYYFREAQKIIKDNDNHIPHID